MPSKDVLDETRCHLQVRFKLTFLIIDQVAWAENKPDGNDAQLSVGSSTRGVSRCCLLPRVAPTRLPKTEKLLFWPWHSLKHRSSPPDLMNSRTTSEKTQPGPAPQMPKSKDPTFFVHSCPWLTVTISQPSNNFWMPIAPKRSY